MEGWGYSAASAAMQDELGVSQAAAIIGLFTGIITVLPHGLKVVSRSQ